MKKIEILALVFAGVFFFPTFAGAAFIEGLEDIPLAPGLTQVQNDNISFGNEESRLVEVSLTSAKIGFAKVEKFYKDTLPQMGWIYQGKRDNILTFYREGEVIDIVRESVKPLSVRITVKSKL